MGRHEHFEQLCAAASIGQASGGELAELQEHLDGCPACQQAYADFIQLSAVRAVAYANEEQRLSGPEAIGYIDSVLFREKFLKQAEAEGIVSTRERVRPAIPEPVNRRAKISWSTPFAFGLAASLLLLLGAVGGYRLTLPRSVSPSRSARASELSPRLPTEGQGASENREATLSRLEAENRKLTGEIASLKASLAKQASSLDQWKATAATSERDRDALLSAAKERDTKIDDLQRQLSQAQTEVTVVQTELEKTQAGNQAYLAAAQARIRELADQLREQSSVLDRERQMLAASRDIRDLMSARNLHIADVFDTDTKGRTRSAFGRVFFTEGRSLIIYAYDLNDHRVQDAGYHYRVWGKKEGPGRPAMSLGIFYSDDKAQRRWVFKNDDPKVLSEIDSVFVTLEPPGKEPTQPKGEKFLYAYLRNQPNHP